MNGLLILKILHLLSLVKQVQKLKSNNTYLIPLNKSLKIFQILYILMLLDLLLLPALIIVGIILSILIDIYIFNGLG